MLKFNLKNQVGFICFIVCISCKNNTSQVLPNNDRLVQCASLSSPDGDYMKEFERIQVDQFGIRITNVNGDRIGCSKAIQGPWKPITGKRETLKGIVTKYAVDTGHVDQDEYDWSLMIAPSNSNKDYFGDAIIECEVTPSDNFRNNIWFPLKGTGKPSLLLNYEVCLYGPYVTDEGNDNGKEIHPIDAIWWNRKVLGNNQKRVMLLQDAAKFRYREENKYIKQSCDDHFSNWKPWIVYPQMEQIKIPFSFDSHQNEYTDISIDIVKSQKITTQNQINWKESDDGAEHLLLVAENTTQISERRTIVRVKEKAGSDDEKIVVQFTDLTCDSQGVIRGYVSLLVALGVTSREDEGILVFNLTFNKKKNTHSNLPVSSN